MFKQVLQKDSLWLSIASILRTRAWENADGVPNTSSNLTHGSAEFTRKKVSDADAVTSVEALEEEEVKKRK